MLLKDKVVVMYGASGATGAALARAFAEEGARLFLTGRHREPLESLAQSLDAEAAHVDALDEEQIERHLALLVSKAGRVDVSFNCTGISQTGIQGIPLAELGAEAFMKPIASYLHSHFVTGRAAARRIAHQRSGVIMMHTPEPGRVGLPNNGGMAPAWAAMEALTRSWSAELAPLGGRAVCLRTTGLPETATIDTVFGLHSKALGIERDQFLAAVSSRSHRGRLTTLAELTAAAVFLARDRASAFTGTAVNLTAGIVAD